VASLLQRKLFVFHQAIEARLASARTRLIALSALIRFTAPERLSLPAHTRRLAYSGGSWTQRTCRRRSLDPGGRAALKWASALDSFAKKTERQLQFRAAIKQFREDDAFLERRVPKFLYFSHYDRMSSELSINQLESDKQTPRGIKIGDQRFLDFLNRAGAQLEESARTTRDAKLQRIESLVRFLNIDRRTMSWKSKCDLPGEGRKTDTV
jgi:hypothetical protein